MQKIQRPKGTQDITPADVSQWQRVETAFKTLCTQMGYEEIRTPVFESTELFSRGVGEATDIVNKEMYTFEKGDRSLTLRPEGTAGVVRSYIEQGMSRSPKPVKLFYNGAMFRYERPQAGRQRQFHQMGMELFGLDTPESDVEMIVAAWQFFNDLGIESLALDINNIGTPECRQQFKASFQNVVKPFLNELCENCQTRFDTNPLRMLDCKVDSCQEIYAKAEVTAVIESDFTSEDCQAHFQKVSDMLTALEIPFNRNYRLVRGLDYYTKTVFEITSSQLGAQSAVCGGGRYNGLVELLGGEPTPATGWALGMERLVSLLGDAETQGPDYYIVTDQAVESFKLAKKLRVKGYSCEVDLSGKNFGKQFQQANKRGAKKMITLGADEVTSGEFQVKDMATGDQQSLKISDV